MGMPCGSIRAERMANVGGKDARDIYLQGHPEYYPLDLAGEYNRDKNKGLNPRLPVSYFPNDDDTADPICTWRSDGHILYRNWVEFLYESKKRRNVLPDVNQRGS